MPAQTSRLFQQTVIYFCFVTLILIVTNFHFVPAMSLDVAVAQPVPSDGCEVCPVAVAGPDRAVGLCRVNGGVLLSCCGKSGARFSRAQIDYRERGLGGFRTAQQQDTAANKRIAGKLRYDVRLHTHTT